MLVYVSFSIFSHTESLSSSTKPFTAKPKGSFLLTFSAMAIQRDEGAYKSNSKTQLWNARTKYKNWSKLLLMYKYY